MPCSNSWRISVDVFDRTSKFIPAVFVDYLKWQYIQVHKKKQLSGSLITESYQKYFNLVTAIHV